MIVDVNEDLASEIFIALSFGDRKKNVCSWHIHTMKYRQPFKIVENSCGTIFSINYLV